MARSDFKLISNGVEDSPSFQLLVQKDPYSKLYEQKMGNSIDYAKKSLDRLSREGRFSSLHKQELNRLAWNLSSPKSDLKRVLGSRQLRKIPRDLAGIYRHQSSNLNEWTSLYPLPFDQWLEPIATRVGIDLIIKFLVGFVISPSWDNWQ